MGMAHDEQWCRWIYGELPKFRTVDSAVESYQRKAAADRAKAAEAAEAKRDAPPGLDDVIGNADSVQQIRTALLAHRARLARARDGAPPAFPHMILSGPGGTGKTLLSEIIAREIKHPIRLQMGQSLTGPARVGDVLLSLAENDVLFIDEMHGLKSACQETLYRAMEDGVFVPILKSGKQVMEPVPLPPFTLIGSTTDEWALLQSLLQRFKYRIRLERMTAEELSQAIVQRAKRRGWDLTDDAARMIAGRSHGTPRIAIGLLDGCMDMALSGDSTAIDELIVDATCREWGIDELGLNKVDRKYLGFLAEAGGKPVRLNVLATRLDGLSRRTVEMRVEPDLVWIGLVEKAADGRRLTEAGREYVKKR